MTIVELSVTVAIVGILAAIAIPSFKNVMPKVRLSKATQTLANEIALSRMSAIAKNTQYMVAINWAASSYTLSQYTDDPSTAAVDFAWRPNATSTLGSGIVFEFTRFQSGQPYTTAADAFVVLNANGTTSVPMSREALWITLATADGLTKRRVVVASTGRIFSQKWLGGTESDPGNWKVD